MQLYLWPPRVPAPLSGGNRLSSFLPLDARSRGGKIQVAQFNIYCTWARVFPVDNAQTPLFIFLSTCIFIFLIFFFFAQQNQAEAHYKGHKHARKLKAMEAQKNRQRRAADASTAGRERERNKTSSDAALPAPSDTSSEKESSSKRGMFVTDLLHFVVDHCLLCFHFLFFFFILNSRLQLPSDY